jgi:hypothetical protein
MEHTKLTDDVSALPPGHSSEQIECEEYILRALGEPLGCSNATDFDCRTAACWN